MNSDLKLAGFIALIVHIGAFFGISTTSRVEFDVQRAPSSIEVFLVSRKLPELPEKVKEQLQEKKELKKPEQPDYFKPLEKVEEVKETEKIEEPVIKKEEPLKKQIEDKKTLSDQTFISPKTKGAITEAKPLYLKNEPPLYPMIARREGYEGTVVLNVEVLSSGDCGRVEIIKSSGYSILDEAALQAVREWKFKPSRRGHTLVTFWVEIPIRFDLEDSGWIGE